MPCSYALFLLLFIYVLFGGGGIPQGMGDLNSLTGDKTHAPYNGGGKYQPLEWQGSPSLISL